MITSEEFSAINKGVVFAQLPRTLIEFVGQDRQSFLHNLCTNEVKALEPGAGCEVFFTNVQGKVLSHGLLLCGSDSIRFSTDADLAEQLLPHFDKYLIREDVEIRDLSTDVQTFLVAGAEAASWLDQEFGAAPEKMLENCFALKPSNLRVARVPFCKDGYYLMVPQQLADEILKRLQAHASELGCEAIEWLRVTAGFPSSGRDVTSNNLPQEIDRNEQAISFVKGCYLGQETVARLDALGHVNKKLVKLEFDGPAPQAGAEVSLDGKTVGVVTSAVPAPEGQPAVGLGVVRVSAIEVGKLDCASGTVRVVA